MGTAVVVLIVALVVVYVRHRRRNRLGAVGQPLTIAPTITRDPAQRMGRTKR